MIHLDIDPEEIGRNFATQIPMVGDVRDSLRELLAHCRAEGLQGRLVATLAIWQICAKNGGKRSRL